MQEIETARLYLRQFTPDDLDELYRIYSDPEIMKYRIRSINRGNSKKEGSQSRHSMVKYDS